MDLADKPPEIIRGDLARIARDGAPCDVVVADNAAGTPDGRVRELPAACAARSAASASTGRRAFRPEAQGE
jgi:hypothetical protein